MSRSRTLFVLLSLVFPGLAVATGLDTAMKKVMKEGHVPGLTFAVTENGKIIKTGHYGVASLELRAPCSDATRFEIASMSKMFAGAAALILIDEGLLSLDDPVSKFFTGLPATWDGMKIRDLLGMSTGLPEDWNVIPWADVLTNYDENSMMEEFKSLKMLSGVGEEFHYSSPGYAMIGMIVEKISKQPLKVFVRDHIFRPAGMTESSYVDPVAVVPGRADGYQLQNDGVHVKRGYYVTPYMHARADAGILSTARDFARWVVALRAGRIVKNPDRIFEPFRSRSGVPLDYGYGWFISPYRGLRAFQHTGGYRTGFSSDVVYFPASDVSVTVLTNLSGAPLDDLVDVLAQMYVPGFHAPKPDVDKDKAETGKLIAALKSLAKERRYPDLIQDHSMSVEVAAARLGAVKEYRFAGRYDLSGRGATALGVPLTSAIALELDFGKSSHELLFYFDKQGHVVHIGD
ncbi:MAG TPA: serine hydrolase domain-containing protein [Fimbriimonadaceae bacterium]|nr:serine hydrolase domain-containing protein [Fimbriimonadaceae bacterium]